MQDQDIPIDIHTNKLLEWMLSRKVCGRDWQKSVLVIREKINNAIQDMPVHKGITRLVSGSYINYFHCLKIVEVLRETEAGSKNLFGSYGSQRMKDWMEVLKLYEREKVYLAEAAQMLIRNVAYEVPSLKKEILHCEAILVECDKKEEVRKKALCVAQHDLDTLRKTLGIAGVSFKAELLDRVTELPEIYAEVARSSQLTLKQPVEFYSQFVKFMIGSEHEGGCVPMLKYIIEKGNTSVYEWTNGKPPPPRAANSSAAPATETEEEDEEDEIDFGDMDVDLSSASSIVLESEDTIQLCVEDPGVVLGACSEAQYATLLDTTRTRDTVIDQLREVECFLLSRLHETTQHDTTHNVLTLAQMQDAPALLQMQTTQSLRNMMSCVVSVLSRLTDPAVIHLHNIKHSHRYVDHLANTLQQKQSVVTRLVALQTHLAAKQADTLTHANLAQPKLKLIVEKTKELQAQIEQEISKLYKNRPVNIMGGVNAL